jgi:cold shock CspA family protein
MFALRKLPAMVGHRAGSLQMLAPRQTAMYASRSRSALFCAAQSKTTGTCKWFNVTKGYGFIAPDDGSQDLFVHQTNIIADGFRSLAEGEAVEFVIERSEDGKAKAVEVTGPNGANPQGAPAPSRDFGGGGGFNRGRGGGGGGGRGGRDDYNSYGNY